MIYPYSKDSIIKIIFLIFSLIVFTSCDDLLDVNDPGAILEDELDNPALEQLIINGVISEFQYTYSYLALWTGVMSGELFTDHTFVGTRQFSILRFDEHNSVNAGLFTRLQQARASADDAVERFESILGEQASRSLNVARALVYGGYAYTFLGENFCSAPVDMSRAYSSEELLEMGIERFNNAITIANAARDAGVSAEESEWIVNLSNNGIARSSLQLGNTQDAISFAKQVPADFEAWSYYSSNSTREFNSLQRPALTIDPWISVSPKFLELDDPRIPHHQEPLLGLNGFEIFPYFRPSQYSEWDPNNLENVVEVSTNIIFSSGLEARYIIAEAEGPTQATLEFVNERRQFGGQNSVNLEGDDLMQELREQRARDFYLTGRRVAVLRRYKALYGLDEFPSGDYPIGDETYGVAECFIIPASERISNPNL